MDLQYEGSENFAALTSFGVVPAYEGLTRLITGKVPGLEMDLSKVKFIVPNKDVSDLKVHLDYCEDPARSGENIFFSDPNRTILLTMTKKPVQLEYSMTMCRFIYILDSSNSSSITF